MLRNRRRLLVAALFACALIAGPTPLAGRDRESMVLREAWAAAAAGRPGLVTITGEAGIGKTALAEALATEAAGDGGTVLRTSFDHTKEEALRQALAAHTAANPAA